MWDKLPPVQTLEEQLKTEGGLGRSDQTCGCPGERGKGEGWTGSLGLVDTSYYI